MNLQMNKELKDTITRLQEFNKWRREDNPCTFNDLKISPTQIGKDIDFVCNLCNNMSSSVTVAAAAFPNVREYISRLEDDVEFLRRELD